MGLIWEILKTVASNSSTDNSKEMDNYGLNNWEKELVKKGSYSPWNFEESDELEEDDYYYEDEN